MKTEENELRIPPHSDEAERAVIGSMMLDPWNSVAKVQRFCLLAESFYDRRNQLIFSTFMDMVHEGKAIDAITFASYLKNRNNLEKAGGYEYLNQLQDPNLVTGHIEHYCDIVRQAWIKRCIIYTVMEVMSETYVSEKDGDELLRMLPERFMGIVDEAVREQGLPEAVDEMMTEFKAAANGEKKMYGLPLPWDNLNEAMCGIPVGFGFIAARPSQGKTTLEDQIFCHWAAIGFSVARITMDMTQPRLLQRAASRAAGVSLPKIKKGFVKFGSKQWDAVAEEAERMKSWPMYINDHDTNLKAICSWIRMMTIKHGIRAVSIDYIQQVYTGTKVDNDENLRLTIVSGTLKALANTLGISIVALSQLNRGTDKDKRVPTMADLRGSGSLEQDAQWIWLLYKDRDVEETKTLRPVWIEIVKQQDGETCGLPFWMYPNYFKFVPAEIGFDSEGNAMPFSDRSVHLLDQQRAEDESGLDVDL